MNTKGEKKTAVVENGDGTELEGFTKRLLLSLVFDVSELRETAERLQVQVFTLAKAHGIVPSRE